MTRLLPLLACLLYAAALLALRHHPGVAERWEAAMQVPRLCVGAWALWVVLRWRKDEGPGSEPPSPSKTPKGRPFGGTSPVPGFAGEDEPQPLLVTGEHPARGRPASSEEPDEGKPPAPLAQPSHAIGVVMGLGCAACVVGGLWADWRAVQALAALAWALTALVAWKA